MTVVRLSQGLPPDLEAELYRETSGETVRWAGQASGLVEKIHGYAMAAAGLFVSVLNLGGPLGVLGLAADLVQRGRLPNGGYGIIFIGILGFAGGLFVARFGWRYVKLARHIVWAVTDKRLLRLVGGGALPTVSWSADQILAVERLNWDEPSRRGLAITAKGATGREVTLIVFGPADLDRAEAALLALTGRPVLQSALQTEPAIA
jgi:hypothetical protein